MGICTVKQCRKLLEKFHQLYQVCKSRKCLSRWRSPILKWHQTFIHYYNNSDSYLLSKASFCYTLYEQSKQFLLYRVCSFRGEKQIDKARYDCIQSWPFSLSDIPCRRHPLTTWDAGLLILIKFFSGKDGSTYCISEAKFFQVIIKYSIAIAIKAY